MEKKSRLFCSFCRKQNKKKPSTKIKNLLVVHELNLFSCISAASDRLAARTKISLFQPRLPACVCVFQAHPPFLCERAHVRSAATCHLTASVSCTCLLLKLLPSPLSKSGLSHFVNEARKLLVFFLSSPVSPKVNVCKECTTGSSRRCAAGIFRYKSLHGQS